jgi:TolB protein
MHSLLRLFLLLALASTSFAGAARQLDAIDIAIDRQTIPIRVSSPSTSLQGLAIQAFGVHGRYRFDPTFRYDIVFNQAGPARVQVVVRQGSGGPVVLSQEVDGTGPSSEQALRNALLRAADLAVERTNEAGLRGFFTSKLAFIGERSGFPEIYTTEDLFFGGTQQVTQYRNHTLFPRWMRDGTRLSFTSYWRSGAADVFVLDLRSMQVSQVANFKGTNQAGPFSPDGSQLAMALSGTGVSQIYVSGVDGRNMRQITFDRNWESTSPVFSPNGSQILFSARPGPRLYLVPAGGGSPRALNTGFSHNAEPDWSRGNPNLISFTIRDGVRFQVAVYDMSTGLARKVSNAPYDAQQAVWLPDGRHLVATFSNANSSELWIIDSVTETAKALSRPAGFIWKASQASVLAR